MHMSHDTFETLIEEIRAALKEAMKAHDELRATTLKGILAAFANEAVALGRTPQSPLSLEEAQRVLRRLLKQREEARAIYAQQGREDLAQREAQEATIIASFLPPQLSEEEVRSLVQRLRSEHPAAQKGQLIGLVMKEAGGRVEGAVVQRIVEEVLQEDA